ncbi:MAG: 50S ribosomal protein L32 [Bacteroidetes bacterium]|nr:50S ribosomal protein L32 [Bacteroidota bacterium]
MPNPKRRHSKTRSKKRRTHYKATVPTTGKCPQCGEKKLMHRACPNCGYYRGRTALIPKKAK